MEADCLDLRSKEGEEESEGVSSILGQNSEKLCPMLDLECMSCGAMFSFGPHLHREKNSCWNVIATGMYVSMQGAGEAFWSKYL